MGSSTFYLSTSAENASQAFSNLVFEAKHDYGSAGYTGTIAEKEYYTMASSEPLEISAADSLAANLLNTRYSDKYGPAGCIELKKEHSAQLKKFLFFGWAAE
jgi:hypothetical protein